MQNTAAYPAMIALPENPFRIRLATSGTSKRDSDGCSVEEGLGRGEQSFDNAGEATDNPGEDPFDPSALVDLKAGLIGGLHHTACRVSIITL